MFNRSTVWILVIAFGLAGLVSGWLYTRQAPVASATVDYPALQAVQMMDAPRDLPPFKLARAGGAAMTSADFQGHWNLVFLGFTHCPDICPTTLATMKPVQAHWRARFDDARRPKLFFISVDPLRDTPEVADRYAKAFSADTVAATTDEKALLAFTQSLSMVFMRNPPEDPARADQYSVDHSAAMAVINPRGQLAGFVRAPFNAETIRQDLDALTEATR